MFELSEAVRGRLIGPKTWDRIVGNFFRKFLQSVSVGAVMGHHTNGMVVTTSESTMRSTVYSAS